MTHYLKYFKSKFLNMSFKESYKKIVFDPFKAIYRI